jgi:4,5-dihydroxyphthalate decarboxylase
MPARLPVTYAGAVYDRTRALYTGEVVPEGVDLTYLSAGIEELFWRQGRYAEFDAAEFSLGAYLAGVGAGEDRFTALPVFPSRAFRHSACYVAAGRDVRTPADLAGRRVGTPEWSMTASLWMRGILGDHYGVDLTAIDWYTGGLDEPGRQEKSKVAAPPTLSVQHIGGERTLSELLLAGELDMVIAARAPRAFLSGDARMRRLFADPRAAERAYFAATGIVPIMHVVVLRRSLAEAHPWLPNTLRGAFERARAGVTAQLRDNAVSFSSLVWEAAYADEEADLLGDAFRYGAAENAAALDAILGYAAEQGFSAGRLALDQVFWPSTLTSARV